MIIADLAQITGRTYPARRRTQNLVGGASPIQATNFSMGHVTCSTCGAYLLNAANGHILQKLTSGPGTDDGQVVFANGWVYVTMAFGTGTATSGPGAYAFGP